MKLRLLLAFILGVCALNKDSMATQAVQKPVKSVAVPNADSKAHQDFSKIKFHFLASGGVNVLVVSCIDFRLRTELETYMTDRLGPDSYDEVALAGSSLGVLNDAFPGWNKTFTDNLDLAIKLHGVDSVIFIDHRDCGAYKQIFGANCCADPAKEKEAHTIQMEKVRKYMKDKYPNLKVEMDLMNLDGSVEFIGPKLDAAPDPVQKEHATKAAPAAAH